MFPSRYESISRPALSDVQAQVIGRLISQHYYAGSQINQEDIREHLFPVPTEDHIETLEDWACRFVMDELAGAGYLHRRYIEGLPGRRGQIYILTQEAIDAYRAWYDQRGHMAEDGNALLP